MNATVTVSIEKMQVQAIEDLQITARSGYHCNKASIQTFQSILKQVHNKAEILQFKPGRKFLIGVSKP